MHWLARTSSDVLSLVLAVVAGILVTLAVVQTWVSDALFDDDRFAGTAVRVLERDDVRGEVRRVIVDQAIAQQPDLVTARPLLETVVDTALTSKAFDPIIAEGARELHRAIFETERRSIILNVSDVMTIAVAALRAYDADLAERVPGGPSVGSLNLGGRGAATRAIEIDRRLEALRWVFIAGAALCMAGSLVAGGSRRRAAIAAGLTLVGGAIVVWLAVGVAADVIRRSVGGGPVVGNAAAAAWDIYAGGLIWWMSLQALAGVAVVTVAASTREGVTARDRVERIAGFVDAAWERRAARVLIAGGVATAGLLFLVAPGPSLRVTAQALGLAMLSLGGTELFRALGIARAREEAPGPAAPARSRVWPRVLAGAGLMAGLAGVMLVFWVNRDSLRADLASARPPIDRCNGHAELCDRRLDEVAFVATHNSMSAAEEPGWYFASHTRGIADQLDDGVRGLLIDVYYGYATNRGVRTDPELVDIPGRIESSLGAEAARAAENLFGSIGPIPPGARKSLYLCHAYCELGATAFDRTLTSLRRFLDQNPNEVVILFLQDYVSPFDVEAAFTRTQIIDYVYTFENGKPLPTLREMIEVDRRIVVLSENVGDTPAPPWYHDGFKLTQETPYEFRSVADLSCRPNRGLPGSPLFQLNHWIARMTPLPSDAEVLNAYHFLLGRARQCELERGRVQNLIAVNFYEVGDVFRVVDTLNGVGD
ncbi:MAG: hypothetical protein IH609_08680 [Dehalococcoidia bacterium]|nr:hypothetical protein [Dehalococcoidia bacterium]